MLPLSILWLFCCGYSLHAQSPERLFYSSMRPEGWDIYLSKDRGETFDTFTEHPALDYNAAISPDGNWIVFTSERDGTPKLYIKSVEGDGVPRLLMESESMQDQITFSPDGNWIAFVSTHEGNADIYRISFHPNKMLNIEDAQNITNHPGGDFRPTISPDGTAISFSSDREHPVTSHSRFPFAMQRTGDIYTMDTSGKSLKRLTESDKWDGSPEWSSDGSQIYFYSLRSGKSRIYRMNSDGSQLQPITPEGMEDEAVSPRLVRDNLLVFTSWPDVERESRPFRLMTLNITTDMLDTFYATDIDMFNIDAHESGLMAFHGGKKPQEKAVNKGGFNGELLVQGAPFRYNLPGITLEGYGVRRAFAAPPDPNGSYIVFAAFEAGGFINQITSFGYAVLLLPVLTLLLFFAGIFLSIKNRKIIKFWRYLLFSGASVLLTAIVLGSFGYLFMELFSLSRIRLYMVGIFVLLIVLGWLSYRIWQKRLRNNNPGYRVSRLTTISLGVNAFFALYLALFSGYFLNMNSDFYRVNYITGETSRLFIFKPDQNTHPAFNTILDTKYKPDGSAIIFSTGSFRGEPLNPGDIWEYHISKKELNKISTSQANEGFADFSSDGSQMVFRSGAEGNMEVYLKQDHTVTNLTNSPDKENFPVISPAGDAIAYISNGKGTVSETRERPVDIYLKTKIGDHTWSEPRRLTSYEGQEAHPHFSPDGEWLVYATEEFGISDEQPLVQPLIFNPQMYGEIVAVRLSDGKKFRLTHNKWEEGAPLWVEGY